MNFRDIFTISGSLSLLLMILPFVVPSMRSSEFHGFTEVIGSVKYYGAVLFALGCSAPLLTDMMTDVFFMPAGKRFEISLMIFLVLPNILKLSVMGEGADHYHQRFIFALSIEVVGRFHTLVRKVVSCKDGKLQSQHLLLTFGSLSSLLVSFIIVFFFHSWEGSIGYNLIAAIDIIVAAIVVGLCFISIKDLLDTLESASTSPDATLRKLPILLSTGLLVVDIIGARLFFYFLGTTNRNMDVIAVGVTTWQYFSTGMTLLAILLPNRVSMKSTEKFNHEFSRKLDFVRYVSHELRSPLNAISVGLYVLAQELQLKSAAPSSALQGASVPSPSNRMTPRNTGSDRRGSGSSFVGRIRSGSSTSTRGSAGPPDVTTTILYGENVASIMEDVMNSCESMVSIMDDLLVFNQIENESFELKKERVEIAGVVLEAISPFYLVANEKGVVLAPSENMLVELGESVVFVDRQRFSNVLKQLVSNAIEFTPTGGKVEINAKIHHPFDRSSSSVLTTEFLRDFVRIEVIDGGPGIVKERRDGLFNDSGKFDPVDFQSGLGTGMGLWISKIVMESHKGRIGVTTRASQYGGSSSGNSGGGTTDYRFPISDDRSGSGDPHNITSSASLSRIATPPTGTVFFVELDLDHSGGLVKTNSQSYPLAVDPMDGVVPGNDGLQMQNPHGDESGKAGKQFVAGIVKPAVTGVAWSGSEDSAAAPRKSSHSHPSAVIPLSHDSNIDTADNLPLMWKRALIVDDVASNRKMLGRVVKNRFEDITYAVNGQEAVDAVANSLSVEVCDCPFDIIFMDCNMPVMDGMEATRRIRQMGYRGVILGVTGNGLQEDIDKFMSAGVSRVLLKPLNIAKFEAALNGIATDDRRTAGGGGGTLITRELSRSKSYSMVDMFV